MLTKEEYERFLAYVTRRHGQKLANKCDEILKKNPEVDHWETLNQVIQEDRANDPPLKPIRFTS